MGASNSKQERAAPTMTTIASSQEEKYAASQAVSSSSAQRNMSSLTQQAYLPHASMHASDRLHRIAAEGYASTRGYKHDLPEVPAHDDSSACITLEALNAWDSVALADPISRMAALTLHDAAISKSCCRRRAEEADIFVFSHEICEALQRSNQKQSGRCWIFAALNQARIGCLRQLNVEAFELSESYLSFYDKLEKSNAFLEYMMEMADRPMDDKVIQDMLSDPAGDGGYWEMATNLIEKYGLVPKATYPESYTSSNTKDVGKIIDDKLREYAIELREMKKANRQALARAGVTSHSGNTDAGIYGLRQRKDEMLATIYRIMAITFGQPPKPDEKFTYQFSDKDGKFTTICCTPREFVCKHTGGFKPKCFTEISGDPRYPEDRLLVVPNSVNVWGGKCSMWANTNPKVMKEAVVKSIKAGMPVWFSCDVGQYRNEGGVMDPYLFNYELPFSIKLGMTKKQKLETQSFSVNHAMCITGVHLSPEGEPIRFKVENSWGGDVGDKGFFVMTAAWFDLYLYTVVIRNDLAPKHLVKLFEDGPNKESIILPANAAATKRLRSSPRLEEAFATGMIAADRSGSEPASDENGEYEIEAILGHQIGALTKGEMAYLVSWKGYSQEHDSWVDQKDAVNCREMLEDYWSQLDAVATKKVSARRKKPTMGDMVSQKCTSQSTSLLRRERGARPSAAAREEMTRQRARIVRRASVHRAGITYDDMSEDVRALDESDARRLEGGERDQQLRIVAAKRYMRLADWHDVVRRIETVEVEHTGRLIAYVVFENGGRYAFDAAVTNHRCPRKMLQFYESRLRFKPRESVLPPLASVSMCHTTPAGQGSQIHDGAKEVDRERARDPSDAEWESGKGDTGYIGAAAGDTVEMNDGRPAVLEKDGHAASVGSISEAAPSTTKGVTLDELPVAMEECGGAGVTEPLVGDALEMAWNSVIVEPHDDSVACGTC